MIRSVIPAALMPDTAEVFPARNAFAPAMSSNTGVYCETIFGSRMRSIACANVRAVTRSPVLKRSPGRNVNVYVRPSRETSGIVSAASGTSVCPALPDLSG